jgi:hypothetical protein
LIIQSLPGHARCYRGAAPYPASKSVDATPAPGAAGRKSPSDAAAMLAGWKRHVVTAVPSQGRTKGHETQIVRSRRPGFRVRALRVRMPPLPSPRHLTGPHGSDGHAPDGAWTLPRPLAGVALSTGDVVTPRLSRGPERAVPPTPQDFAARGPAASLIAWRSRQSRAVPSPASHVARALKQVTWPGF